MLYRRFWVALFPASGLGTIAHLVPFQDSTRVWVTVPTSEPTAVQLSAAVQETPLRPGLFPWFGLGTIDHFLPFQDSIRVWNAVPLGAYDPTAVQLSAVVQETPSRPFLPARSGLVTTDHVVPFQVSTSVCGGPEGSVPWLPTAVQAVSDTQETAVRRS